MKKDFDTALNLKLAELERNPQKMLCERMRGKMKDCTAITSSCANNATCAARIEKALAEIKDFSPEAADALALFLLPCSDKRHITQKQLIARLEKLGMHDIPICAFCFAERALTVGSGEDANIKYSAVGVYLSAELRKPSELPIVPGFFGAAVSAINPAVTYTDGGRHERLESFGDVSGVLQARNYLRICRNNPAVYFSAWTKNPDFWYQAALAEGGKPENLKLILSSYRMNTPDYETAARYNALIPGFFDSLFTVYTPAGAARAGIVLNCCGSERDKIIPRECKTCMNCYLKNGNPETVQFSDVVPGLQIVNEVLR